MLCSPAACLENRQVTDAEHEERAREVIDTVARLGSREPLGQAGRRDAEELGQTLRAHSCAIERNELVEKVRGTTLLR
jgi:hypothetical protein